MKQNCLFLVLAGLVLSACVAKETGSVFVDNGEEVFYATIEEPAVRVSVDCGLRVLWNADDRVSIFNRYTFNREYRFDGKDGENSGTFVLVPNDAFIVGNSLDKVYAVYPYREDTRISNDGEITVTLPSEQGYRVNSFGPGANTMISVTDDNQLLFRNLCGYLTLRLYGDNVSISSLSVRGNDSEPLAGQATVVARTDQVPTLTFEESAATEIFIRFDTPVLLGDSEENATVFWLVIPPVTFSEGITLTVTDSEGGRFEKTASSSFTIERNTLSKMASLRIGPSVPGEVTGISLDKAELSLAVGQTAILHATVEPEEAADKTVTWTSSDENVATVDGEGCVTAVNPGTATITAKAGEKTATCQVHVNAYEDNNTPIPFADDKVKAKLVAAFDTNGDGELSYAEAAAVTSGEAVKSAFGAIKTYKSFDEFQFFTGLSSLPEAMFKEWNLLASVTLPPQIQQVSGELFMQCLSLASITLPERVTTIGASAFKGCSGLASVTILGKITSIEDNAFEGCSSLTGFSIPDSVTGIGQYAFKDCSSVTSVSLPGSVTTIPNGLFEGCSSLTSIVFPDGVTKIGHHAFEGCSSLTSIVFPDGVTKIGVNAFKGCNLSEISLPLSVTSVNDGAFKQNSKQVHMRGTCTGRLDKYVDTDCLVSYDIIDGVTTIGENAFYGCTGLESVTIPNSVTTVGRYAFQNCSGLKSVVLPDSVKDFAHFVFAGCSSLESAVLPEGLSTIGTGTFNKCSSLRSISIPESVTVIMDLAFIGCSSLVSVVLPKSLTTLQEHAFEGCSALKSLRIPQGVTAIGGSTFADCSSLETVDIPGSVTEIGTGAFQNCSSLKSVVIPDSVTEIGPGAFQNCSSLKSTVIPESIRLISYNTFAGCSSLSSVVIPESVVTIDSAAFKGCSGLPTVALPESVATIGVEAFSGCRGLASFYSYRKTPPAGSTNMLNDTNDCPILVPAESVELYKANWNFYATRIRAIEP